MSIQTFNTIIILAAIVSVIIEVWLIVKFVELCGDVKKIREKQEPEKINAATVRKAILTGKTDEVYEAIVSRLIDEHEAYGSYGHWDDLEPKTRAAEAFCAMMNRELPPQLQSREAYLAFLKSMREAGEDALHG